MKEAISRQQNDIQILFLLGYLYLQQNENEKANDVLVRLVEQYPRNALYKFYLGELCYRKGDMSRAISLWAESVWYMPRLLDTERLRDLYQYDLKNFNSMKERIIKLGADDLESPVDCARYGFLLHRFGFCNQAEKYLRRAVDDLPNLSVPWYLLSDKRKYNLLNNGAFQLNTDLDEDRPVIVLTDADLIRECYGFKYENWYGSSFCF